jgi:hypothetical protein
MERVKISKLKKAALDSTLWRTDFRRDYGLVRLHTDDGLVTFHKCFMGGVTNQDVPQVVPMLWGKNACDHSAESSERGNQTIPQELQLQRKSLYLVMVL